MSTTEPKQDAFIAFGDMARDWGDQYRDIDLAKKYPAGVVRLRIVMKLLDRIKPAKILDVGCGTGAPLAAFLKAGHDAIGFDYADGMLDVARQTLAEVGFNPGLVSKNNMEDPQGFEEGSFDCICALGSLYYARDFNTTMARVAALLSPGGHFIFSLRNDLFSMFSMNRYTVDFIRNKLIATDTLSAEAKEGIVDDLSKAYAEETVKKVMETVDDKAIHSLYHNPLTVEAEILNAIGCEQTGIYYYHFHALPPKYEHTMTEEFRRLSWQMENPFDWRGVFMASTFIVHARKAA